MKCHEIKELLLDYLYSELPETKRQEVAKHLAECADCRSEFVRLQTARDILNQLKPVPVSADLPEKMLRRLPGRPKPRIWLRFASGVAVAAAILLALVIILQNPPSTPAGEPAVKKGSFTVTVYNDNLAMVKDASLITNLKKGANTVRFYGVTSGIKPDSVSFKSLTDPLTTQVLEQNYEYDLVSAAKVLDKYLDREIKVLTEDKTIHQGRLVSFEASAIRRWFEYETDNNGSVMATQEQEKHIEEVQALQAPLQRPVIRRTIPRTRITSEGGITIAGTDGRLEIIPVTTVSEIRLGPLPPNLVTRPTLVWDLGVKNPGEHQVEVGYLTEGMFWNADYIAIVSPDDRKIDFKGWVTIRNNSGATFPEAALKLIAGDVNIIKPPSEDLHDELNQRKGAVETAEKKLDKLGFVEKAFFEYHMYTLQGRTTLKDKEVKQITLFPELKQVPVKKIYLYNGSIFGKKVRTILEFENIKENNMGIPLPKGTIKVFKVDEDKLLEHIADDQIDHTPAGKKEKVRIFFGNAFDIVGEWRQTDTKNLGNNTSELTYEIKLRHHMDSLRSPQADKEVEVIVQEDHLEGAWEIVKKSHEYEKKNAHTIEFTVKVPASPSGGPENGKEVVVTYTVRRSY